MYIMTLSLAGRLCIFQQNVCLCGTNNDMLLIMRKNAYTIDCNSSHLLILFALLFQLPNFKLLDTICSVFKQILNCLEDRLKVLDCHLELNVPRQVCAPFIQGINASHLRLIYTSASNLCYSLYGVGYASVLIYTYASLSAPSCITHANR